MLGSSVLPDLLETINRVFGISILFSKAFTCAGSVESRTCKSGWPAILPNVLRRTSGQRLEPPMPSKSASLKPALVISWLRFLSSAECASCSSTISSQPSHSASSLPVHSVASRDQRRCILPPDCHSPMAVFTAAARDSGSEDFSRLKQSFLFAECFFPPLPATCGMHRQIVLLRRRSASW